MVSFPQQLFNYLEGAGRRRRERMREREGGRERRDIGNGRAEGGRECVGER